MAENKQAFFNKLADGWDACDTVPEWKYRKIASEALLNPRHKILDAGCGTGVLIPYILEAAGKESPVFAVDYSQKMIENLREKNFPANVQSFVMNIQKTDFDNCFFDRIIVNSCYPHFEEKPSALKELHRILKKNGILTISHPTGREHVNRLHKTHSLIEEDVIDEIPRMKEFIEPYGFKFIKGIDEPDFFLISFAKQPGRKYHIANGRQL